MPVKKYKPISAGTRFRTGYDFAEITTSEPEKSLLESMTRSSGRNSYGRVTSRRRGGGHKKTYRRIDFRRDKIDIPAKVATIEYDPNRSARIALLNYADGEKRYILVPVGLNVGDAVLSSATADIKPGNTLPIANIPVGTIIHNIELTAGRGGQMARSAGCFAQLMAKVGDYAQVKLASGEVRMVRTECKASIGQVGNLEHENISIGKAGRNRWMGKRPKVRGVAMNPVDHPLGGGEGKSSGGRPPVSPWGKPEGVKTRHNKSGDKYIVKRRSK